MPGRLRRLFDRDDGPGIRDVHDGESYTEEELRAGLVRLIGREARDDPPAVETQGEPWGWTKGPPYPRGHRDDDDYGPRYRDRADPGPYDGAWEPPAGGGA